MSDAILVKVSDGVATVTLNRPEKGNVLDPPAAEALTQALRDLAANRDLKAVVLRGAGADFCAGREAPPPPPGKARTPLEVREVLEGIARANAALLAVPVPTIAALRGRALGFGCGLVIRSDVVLAAEGARLGFPEIKGDLPPTIILSYLGRVAPRKKAFELVITGREIGPEEAERLGIVTRVVPADRLDAEVDALAAALAARPRAVVQTCKEFFRDIQDMTADEAARHATSVLANVLASRKD
jgi:enoyl-CoA hydratase/carnithine racemase